MITVDPPNGSNIVPADVLTADVVGGDAWIAVQYDSSPAVEVVHDGTSFAPRFTLSSVAAISGGVRFAVRRLGGWPGLAVTLRYYEMTSEMSSPIVDKEYQSDSSGDERVALQLPYDVDLRGAVIAALVSVLGASSSGTAVFRAYLGGNRIAQSEVYDGSGTFVGSVNAVSPTPAPLRITGAPIANPGGQIYLTITYQSSGPGNDVFKYGLTGEIQ